MAPDPGLWGLLGLQKGPDWGECCPLNRISPPAAHRPLAATRGNAKKTPGPGSQAGGLG